MFILNDPLQYLPIFLFPDFEELLLTYRLYLIVLLRFNYLASGLFVFSIVAVIIHFCLFLAFETERQELKHLCRMLTSPLCSACSNSSLVRVCKVEKGQRIHPVNCLPFQ